MYIGYRDAFRGGHFQTCNPQKLNVSPGKGERGRSRGREGYCIGSKGDLSCWRKEGQ